jgi:hypothetical protein
MSKKYIDVDNIDIERIPCYYGGECHIEDVEEWINELPVEENLVEVTRCAKCMFANDHPTGNCMCSKTNILHDPSYYCADGKI